MWRLLLCLLCVWMPPAAASETGLPRADGTDLRVLVWNVSRQNFFDQAAGYAQVLRLARADLWIFDEMPADRSAADVQARLQQVFPGESWQVSYGATGFGQRSVLVARSPWTPVPEFERLRYPKSLVRKLRALPLTPEQHRRLMADAAEGVAVHAALTALDGRITLVVGVDLQCCGDRPDSIEEQRRLVETQLIREAIERVLRRTRVDAVIVGGDFNTTQGRAPVQRVQGPAGSRWHLDVAESRHPDGQDWTWDGRGTVYPSKKLDYLLFSAALEVRAARVFDSESSAQSERAAWGLAVEALRPLSEHRPQIVDLAWRKGHEIASAR